MTDEQIIHNLLQAWCENTRLDRKDLILAHHATDLQIDDVLPPMKYESAAAYRASWGDWHPENVGENIFEFQDLAITAGTDVAFAHGFIRCGGTTSHGKKFEDIVRVTFCLKSVDTKWQVAHQHVSKPLSK